MRAKSIPGWMVPCEPEHIARLLTGACVLIVAASGVRAYGDLRTLDYPGATSTEAQGISGNNVIGSFSPHGEVHEFIYDGLTYTPLTGIGGATAYGISGNKIVGYYNAPYARGFLYDGTTFTTLVYPGAQYTIARAISGSNIIGSYAFADHSYRNFLYDGSTYTTLTSMWGTATGISGDNIVGSYGTAGGTRGFLYDGSTFTTLAYPGALNTNAHGIDGDYIVGWFDYDDRHGTAFLYDGSTYKSLLYPGSLGTYAYGIFGDNIVGSYYDGITWHGFMGTTADFSDAAVVPVPSAVLLGALGLAYSGWKLRKRREL